MEGASISIDRRLSQRRSSTPLRLARTVVGCLAAGLLAVGASSLSVAGAPAASLPSAATSDSPIQHVVIIYQENHSFDDVLGVVCQARPGRCDGYTGPVTFADGRHAANIVEPDIVPTVEHVPSSQVLALANRWDELSGCREAPHDCVTHYLPGAIPNLSRLARRFAISDHSFASDITASFGAHITLAAGTIDGFVGSNPHHTPGVPIGPGWGCASNRTAAWASPEGDEELVPSCIPDKEGDGPFRDSPVPYAATVMERLEHAGLSWHVYQGHKTTEPVDNLWSVCAYFYWCSANRFDLTHDSRTNDFVAAAGLGTLPTLSMLLPQTSYSQHNTNSMRIGDNYIGRMVRAVEDGPEWDSTAIFITYDDCGCFYDHVTPPGALGIRAPMVIVSPWVRAGFTDRSQAVVPYSMLAFVQQTFGLGPLTPAVAHAYDYQNAFDFDQAPLGRATMTKGTISAGERRRLAAMPHEEDDPT
jgi:phospholipase C